MVEKTAPDLSGFAGMIENWQATQSKFMPSGQIMTQFAETILTLSQAQITYQQTVMRANAALLTTIWKASMPTPLPAPEHGTKKATP